MSVASSDTAPASMPDWSGRPSSFQVRGSAGETTPAPAAERLRVLLASATPDGGGVADLLPRLGHELVAHAGSAADAVASATGAGLDAVLLDVALLDEAGTAAQEVAAAAPGLPIVLYCADPDVRLADRQLGPAAAIAWLPAPVAPGYLDALLRLATQRARALEAARHEAAEARRQLEERKLIERAKGVLMRRTGMSEQDAYSAMRRQSQDRSEPLVRIARTVLESEPGRRTA